MKKCCSMLFVLALAVILPMQVLADEMVSLKVGYINLNADGSFATTKTVLTEVNMDDDEDEVMAEAALQLGAFRLSASYLPLNFSGQNQDFTSLTTVRGNMDVDLYDLGLTWYLLNFDDLPVRFQLGPELSVKVVDGEVSTFHPATGLREKVSGTVPVPTIGARARVGLADFLAVTGRVGYVEYSDNTFLDADAQIELSPIPLVGLFGGYRYLDLDVDEDDIFIDATFKGPYAGAFLRF
jgi:hypothetical protein